MATVVTSSQSLIFLAGLVVASFYSLMVLHESTTGRQENVPAILACALLSSVVFVAMWHLGAGGFWSHLAICLLAPLHFHFASLLHDTIH